MYKRILRIKKNSRVLEDIDGVYRIFKIESKFSVTRNFHLSTKYTRPTDLSTRIKMKHIKFKILVYKFICGYMIVKQNEKNIH